MPNCEFAPTCPDHVTHLEQRGFIYCTRHANAYWGYGETIRARKLRVWELRLIALGKAVPSYKPLPVTEARKRFPEAFRK